MALNPKTVSPALTIAAGTVPGPAAEPWWSDDNGIGGANASAVKASLNLGSLASHDLSSVVEAIGVGSYGNDITVQAIGDRSAGAGVSITVTDKAVVIHYESGVSTVAQVEAAIAALSGVSRVIAVKTPGTGASILVAPGTNFAATHLAGGLNRGHQVDGLHPDSAFVEIAVSAWGSVTKVEIVAEVNGDPHGAATWAALAPVSPIMNLSSPYLDFTGGKLYLLAAASTKPVRIPLFCEAAKRYRVGLRAADHAADATFACTAKVGFVQRVVNL